jgi:uncharacterized SAM-binding protein YcdF (DUF218 family)
MMLQGPIEQGLVWDLDGGRPVEGIIVLGGQPSRFIATADLAMQYPHARLVASGTSEAEIEILLQRGVLISRILVTSAANTYENAQSVNRIVQRKAGERWLLVTSALHMRRARGAFCSIGFQVEPSPVFDLHKNPRYAAPAVVREALALTAYWMRGLIRECRR